MRADVADFTPEKILARARENGIQKIICIGTSHADSLVARDFAAAHEDVFWAYGIHPDEAGNFDMGDAREGPPNIPQAIAEDRFGEDSVRPLGRGAARQDPWSKLLAIGEIGLDYRNGTEKRKEQIELLEQMLQLATDQDLPCIFHVREAFNDFFAVLDNFPKITHAVVHSFSDSPENLEKSLDRGFCIGVNGLATFAEIPLPPLERTLLETDAPFLSPRPFRGKVNEPSRIKNIAEFLAEKHGVSLETVAEVTTKNSEELFGI